MLDPDTGLLYLYVMADEFCTGQLPPERPPGPAAALSRGELVALALCAQWARFASGRAFYRYAARRLRGAFPTLPDRSRFNRLLRAPYGAVVAFGHHLASLLGAQQAPYEALDCSGVPVRHAQRRGAGWLAGIADIGWSGRLGWYEGFPLLTAVTPTGVLPGCAVAPASTKEQRLAEDALALRRHPDPRGPGVGRPAAGPYLADNGSVGAARPRRWEAAYGARVLCPPQRSSPRAGPRALRRWHARLRQVVETVYDKLPHAVRLRQERPHTLAGFQARLAAQGALHNFCLWLNEQRGRPRLAFAALIAW
jgi:hypothetical protein